MEDLKIRVNSEAESKEAQELFFELGGKWCAGGCDIKHTNEPYFYLENGLVLYGCLAETFITEKHKEITLPELRDMVVLKRNDVGDKTHDGVRCGSYYVTSDNTIYFYDSYWVKLACASNVEYIKNHLKPIEKPMKEYLRKNSNGTYSYIGTVRPEHVSDFMIEIPQGAECLTQCGEFKAFWKDGAVKFLNCDDDWDFKFGMGVDRYIELAREDGCEIVWLRKAHPEELPFIDDEPLQSLNDQYAEIEKVRQSAWKKQEGGSHYKNLKIQPMQYALENKLDYAQANVVKYVTRHKEKNGKEDLLKAIHNIELMIEFYYGDEK